MEEKVFYIKSITVQNTIMLFSLSVVAFFLAYFILKRYRKGIILFTIWIFLVIWFFNSPFFGFSLVGVSSKGIRIDYGILSFRNTTLPLNTPWKIESHLTGIRKNRLLYDISIGSYRSMRVRAGKGLQKLKEIGNQIEIQKRLIKESNYSKKEGKL